MTESVNPYRPPDAPTTDPRSDAPVFRVRLIPATAFGLSGVMILGGLAVQAGLMAWVLARYGRRSLDSVPRSLALMTPTAENLVRIALMAATAGFALVASSYWMKGRWPRAVGASLASCLLMAVAAIIAPE